jgi:hypothetical protein
MNYAKSFRRKVEPNLASAGDAKLLGSTLNHYTMVVTERPVSNFDLEVVPTTTATKKVATFCWIQKINQKEFLKQCLTFKGSLDGKNRFGSGFYNYVD